MMLTMKDKYIISNLDVFKNNQEQQQKKENDEQKTDQKLCGIKKRLPQQVTQEFNEY